RDVAVDIDGTHHAHDHADVAVDLPPLYVGGGGVQVGPIGQARPSAVQQEPPGDFAAIFDPHRASRGQTGTGRDNWDQVLQVAPASQLGVGLFPIHAKAPLIPTPRCDAAVG